MITLSDVTFRYGDGDFVLRVPDLRFEAGETAAVVGPSGSGKTTLLNLIAGIALPGAGRVATDGVEVSTLSDGARRDFRIHRVGLVFQEFELLEYLDVLDNILLPYRVNASLRLDGAVRDRARALARRVGIGDKLARHPSRLSQGERQRVALCRAVLPQPNVLLADEPTGNLDPVNAGRVLDILLDYAQESGSTLLTVTHDHALIPRFGREVDLQTMATSGTRAGGDGLDAAGGSAS